MWEYIQVISDWFPEIGEVHGSNKILYVSADLSNKAI